jgi:aminoglycoside/choline kinase family phosphotransferase
MSLPPPVLALVRRNLDLADDARLTLEKIEKGGSDREFYRASSIGAAPFILVKYGSARAENARYAAIAEFLHQRGVAVPRILFHDPSEGLMAMEDLGGRDLWTYRTEPWEVRRPLFQSALREVHRLHSIGLAELAAAELQLEPPFDDALYRWEQDYFFENCLGGTFAAQVSAERIAALAAQPVWESIRRELAARPRVLVHRDFQSQNVMIHDGRAGLIDFQGLRPGLAHYDLASLLFDPRDSRAQLARSERSELLDFYRGLGLRPDLGRDEADFMRILRLSAVQRMMQALGTYGFLPLKRGRTEFQKFVPGILANLRDTVALVPELAAFGGILAPLRAESPEALEQ